ncbi:aconitase X [Simiduia agarivorans]|uniref:Phosphomevalonate dehydratase large subunit-like domain-containing protein n=1 Tax=Simiduia agarivorans (strain DSM 21679 / JCM 13881 / BCRC 17597 / SA1) TaxID=1117647 RepID=K4KQB5_SIMAS|nr:aconitase X [Simiduia agarivorans]AFV00309.1 hypothetical protein M5M_15880 [Simiduia agarivorans SA1 = DSM 21679]
MQLTDKQQAWLDGSLGPEFAQCMATLVRYGEAFGATRLVPIVSAHLTGSFKIASFKGYYAVVEKLVAAGLKVKVPTTANPRPGYDFSLQNRLVLRGQQQHEQNLEALGVTPNYSCVCYHEANIPRFGDILGWAESSAIIYANSVIGARSNRNSILVDICQAITGLTPEFGFLLDQNRAGQIRVKLDIQVMDAAALGFILGKRCVDKTPVLDHYPFSATELKNMGGAMAASGSVSLFHVLGLTPEAPDEATAFRGREPEQVITITQADLTAVRANQEIQNASKIVAFGCPQMTLEEALATGEHFVGKKVKKRTLFHLVPADLRRLEKLPMHRALLEAGVELYAHCPLAGLSVRIGLGSQQVLTNSGKLYYYLDGTEYGDLSELLAVCGVL